MQWRGFIGHSLRFTIEEKSLRMILQCFLTINLGLIVREPTLKVLTLRKLHFIIFPSGDTCYFKGLDFRWETPIRLFSPHNLLRTILRFLKQFGSFMVFCSILSMYHHMVLGTDRYIRVAKVLHPGASWWQPHTSPGFIVQICGWKPYRPISSILYLRTLLLWHFIIFICCHLLPLSALSSKVSFRFRSIEWCCNFWPHLKLWLSFTRNLLKYLRFFQSSPIRVFVKSAYSIKLYLQYFLAYGELFGI